MKKSNIKALHDKIVILATNHTCKEVAEIFGIKYASLFHYAGRKKIIFKNRIWKLSTKYKGIPKEKIAAYSKNHTIKETVKKYGFSEDAFRYYVARNELKFRPADPVVPSRYKKPEPLEIDDREKIMTRLRRKFGNVYPRSIYGKRFDGEYVIGNKSFPKEMRIFPTWEDFMKFAKPYLVEEQ